MKARKSLRDNSLTPRKTINKENRGSRGKIDHSISQSTKHTHNVSHLSDDRG